MVAPVTAVFNRRGPVSKARILFYLGLALAERGAGALIKLRGSLVLAGLVLAPCVVAAEPLWFNENGAPTPGQLYAAGKISGGVQHLPKFKSTFSSFTTQNGPFLSAADFNPKPSGVEPGGAVGYFLRDGTVPAWLGQRPRVEVSAEALTMKSHQSSSQTLAASNGIVVSGIGGSTYYNGLANVDQTSRQKLRLHRDGFLTAFKAASDFMLAPDLWFTPSLTLRGGTTRDAYKLRGRSSFQSFEAVFQTDEKVNTTEIGVEFGGALAWQFHKGWALIPSGTIGPSWVHSELDGKDCANLAALPPGTSCGPGNDAYFGSNVSDSASTVGFRTGGSLALAVDLGFGTVTLGGLLSYDSQLPGVDNPQATVQTAGSTTNPSARIRFDDGIAYGGTLNVMIPLGIGL